MCGICGVWGAGGLRSTEAMVARMHHRGPDDRGVIYDSVVSLGMTRLSILDLTPTGRQPMSNPAGTVWIVYNGEVYNFRSERRMLEDLGHTFASTSDTEVVLRMYEHYGDDFLSRLRGMFALAIYDRRRGTGRERLLLARDQLGVKPLLYARVGSRLVFASEMRALLESGLVDRAIDPVALRQLLTVGSVFQPRTILRGVQMLLPAHRIVIENGRERIERYWSLETSLRGNVPQQTYGELVEELSELLYETVRLQMISDVPLGAFLSGGVDSSVLVAMMAQIAGKRIKTFSVGFEQEGAGIDESNDAETTARYLGTDHTNVIVTGREVRDRISHIASSLDQPSHDGVNSYFVSLAARRSVTVAVSGTGGDEIFAGYPRFIQMSQLESRGHQSPLRAATRTLLAQVASQRAFDPLMGTRYANGLHMVRKMGGFLEKYSQTYYIFDDLAAYRMLSNEMRKAARAGRPSYLDHRITDELVNGTTLQRVSGLCLRGYANNQLLRDIDAVSMAHSLEVRVPYLDPVLVRFAISLPDRVKLKELSNGQVARDSNYRESGAKRILVDVGRQHLSEDIDLQPKRGFSMPFAFWLKGYLQDVLQDTLSDDSVRKRGLLDVRAVSHLRHSFLEGRVDWSQPWMLMMLELWIREVLQQSSGRNHDHQFNSRAI